MTRLTRVGHNSTKKVAFILVLPCLVDACAWLCMVPVSLLAGSEPAARPPLTSAWTSRMRSSTHGSNTRSGRVRNGCGSILQDSLSYGNPEKQYLIYQTTLFGNGRMQFLLRKCSPMPLLFLTVIARLLRNSLHPEHRILITINKLPGFYIDFE